jgi:hypothetical protein
MELPSMNRAEGKGPHQHSRRMTWDRRGHVFTQINHFTDSKTAISASSDISPADFQGRIPIFTVFCAQYPLSSVCQLYSILNLFLNLHVLEMHRVQKQQFFFNNFRQEFFFHC